MTRNDLIQGLPNYVLWAKSGLLPDFVNTVLLGASPCLFTYTLWWLFSHRIAELSLVTKTARLVKLNPLQKIGSPLLSNLFPHKGRCSINEIPRDLAFQLNSL